MNATPTILDYGRAETRQQPESGLLKFVLWCGLLPLGVGLSIFLAWLITRATALPVLGFFWLVIGTLIVAIGGLALLGYVVEGLLAGISWRRVFGRATLLLLLLLVNFPAAAVIIHLVNWIDPNLAPD
jgi:hypothetical protein